MNGFKLKAARDKFVRSYNGITDGERAQIQNIADKYNTNVEVVGSRAAGEGRNIDTDLPVGHGPSTRSDIDFRIDAGHPAVDDLVEELNQVGNGAGSANPRWNWNSGPATPPVITFVPGGNYGFD